MKNQEITHTSTIKPCDLCRSIWLWTEIFIYIFINAVKRTRSHISVTQFWLNITEITNIWINNVPCDHCRSVDFSSVFNLKTSFPLCEKLSLVYSALFTTCELYYHGNYIYLRIYLPCSLIMRTRSKFPLQALIHFRCFSFSVFNTSPREILLGYILNFRWKCSTKNVRPKKLKYQYTTNWVQSYMNV